MLLAVRGIQVLGLDGDGRKLDVSRRRIRHGAHTNHFTAAFVRSFSVHGRPVS